MDRHHGAFRLGQDDTDQYFGRARHANFWASDSGRRGRGAARRKRASAISFGEDRLHIPAISSGAVLDGD